MLKVASFTQLHHGVYRFAAATTGASAGPHVTILGGVHGNERIGVRVLDALRLALFGVSPLRTSAGTHVIPTLTRGSITLAYGNPAAIRIGTRGSSPHADLNRCFPLDVLSSPAPGTEQSYEQRRARELAPILATSDILLDLHSTNKPSEPFVRIAGHTVVPSSLLQIAQRLPCSILLHDPKYLLAGGHVALTDEFVGAHGGLGVCFESGVATDVSDAKVERIVASILDVLAHDAQVIAPLAAPPTPQTPLETFEITQVFTLTDAGFRWANGIGDTNFQCVRAHEPIGFVGDAPFAVDYDAHIVFPKVAALWRVGAYVLLGISYFDVRLCILGGERTTDTDR